MLLSVNLTVRQRFTRFTTILALLFLFDYFAHELTNIEPKKKKNTTRQETKREERRTEEEQNNAVCSCNC